MKYSTEPKTMCICIPSQKDVNLSPGHDYLCISVLQLLKV